VRTRVPQAACGCFAGEEPVTRRASHAPRRDAAAIVRRGDTRLADGR